MSRRRRKCHLLEISSVAAVPGTSLTFVCGPVNLNDGEFYKLVITPNILLPNTLTGTEAMFVSIAGVAYPLGDRRSRIVRSERVDRDDVICMIYTVDSLVGSTTPTTASPAFIVLEGIDPLR